MDPRGVNAGVLCNDPRGVSQDGLIFPFLSHVEASLAGVDAPSLQDEGYRKTVRNPRWKSRLSL